MATTPCIAPQAWCQDRARDVAPKDAARPRLTSLEGTPCPLHCPLQCEFTSCDLQNDRSTDGDGDELEDEARLQQQRQLADHKLLVVLHQATGQLTTALALNPAVGGLASESLLQQLHHIISERSQQEVIPPADLQVSDAAESDQPEQPLSEKKKKTKKKKREHRDKNKEGSAAEEQEVPRSSPAAVPKPMEEDNERTAIKKEERRVELLPLGPLEGVLHDVERVTSADAIDARVLQVGCAVIHLEYASRRSLQELKQNDTHLPYANGEKLARIVTAASRVYQELVLHVDPYRRFSKVHTQPS